MTKLLENKTILVTGGSRGIGKAIVNEAVKEGAFVIFTYHDNEQAANEVVKRISQIGGKILAIRMALEEIDSIKQQPSLFLKNTKLIYWSITLL